MKNVSQSDQIHNKLIQSLILFFAAIAIIALASSCQKEDLAVTSSDSSSSIELKTVEATGYNQVRNSIAKRAELETYCNTDYLYTDSVIINGVAWQYPSSGYEYLMYKGLRHFADANNNYFYCGLEWPSNAYEYGIGFGTRVGGPGYYAFTANVQISFPEKNYTIRYDNAPCFAIGDQSLANADSIRIILHKRQTKDVTVVADSTISFVQLKEKLGVSVFIADSIVLNSSLGRISSYSKARVYNWIYYSPGTSDVYGLENSGVLTQNLNFGDALAGDCCGSIDIYLHKNNIIYKCTTSYSIFYNSYMGNRKQLHIYE